MKKKRMRRRILIALGVFLLLWGAWRIFVWQMASQEQARFEARGYTLDLEELAERYAAPLPEENAAEYYRQAGAAIGDMSALSNQIDNELRDMKPGENGAWEFSPKLQQLFEEWPARMEKGAPFFEKAAACAESRWYDARQFENARPIEPSYYRLQQLLFWNLRYATVAGEPEWIHDASAVASGFLRSMTSEPFFEYAGTYFYARKRMAESAPVLDPAYPNTQSYLDALRAIADDSGDPLPVREIISVEAARLHAILERPSAWRRTGGPLFDSATLTGQLLRNDLLEAIWPSVAGALGLGDLARYQFLRFTNRLLDAYDLPAPARSRVLSEQMIELESRRGFLFQVSNFWALEQFVGFYGDYQRHQSQFASLRVAVAIQYFHRAQNRMPHTLDELVPAYIDAMPEDSAAPGLPMVYVVEEGFYAVYSRGYNGVDDTTYDYRGGELFFHEMDVGVAMEIPGLWKSPQNADDP